MREAAASPSTLLAGERDFSDFFFFFLILFYSPSPAPCPLQENPSEGLRERAPKSLSSLTPPQTIYNVKYFANVLIGCNVLLRIIRPRNTALTKIYKYIYISPVNKMFAMVCNHVSLLTRGEGCPSSLRPAQRQPLSLLALQASRGSRLLGVVLGFFLSPFLFSWRR